MQIFKVYFQIKHSNLRHAKIALLKCDQEIVTKHACNILMNILGGIYLE